MKKPLKIVPAKLLTIFPTKMNQKYISHTTIAILSWLATAQIFAQTAENTAVTTNSADNTGVYLLLTVIAIALLVPIYILGQVLVQAIGIKQNQLRKNPNFEYFKVLLPIAIFLSTTANLIAQQTEPTAIPYTFPAPNSIDWVLIGFALTIFIESATIFYLSIKVMQFLNPKDSTEHATAVKPKNAIAKWWEKVNNFVPIEKEAELDSGHSYDGIRELNNITPPWFSFTFLLSIIFAIGYMWRYHIAQSAPLQIEEYNIAVQEAKIQQQNYLKKQANNVDENSVKLLGDNEIAAGQKIFATNCAPCHGANAASQPGGVGPNLTDNHWIHGGDIQSVFKTIKYGYPDKGMKSWKDDFSPNQIAQLASYIESIKGKNVAGGKEPQGEIDNSNNNNSNTATNDTTKTQNDTTKTK